jgi:uncharacterized protein (TIGR02996 family)
MEEEAFLRGIVANPEDDTARLVYADWLDERGFSRGEFLRNAVALRSEASRPVIDRLLGLWSMISAEWLRRAERGLCEEAIREVAFKHLTNGRVPASGCFLQVNGGEDPSPFLLALLSAPFAEVAAAPGPLIQPRSEAADGPGGIYDQRTNEPGHVIGVGTIDWVEEDCCTLEGSIDWGPLSASGDLFRIGMKNHRWVVLERTFLWIS